jgi:hypothetical protein
LISFKEGALADAAPLALTTKLLRRSQAPAEFDLYKAALEWSLVDPIIINSRADLKSQSRWKSQGLEPYTIRSQTSSTSAIAFP